MNICVDCLTVWNRHTYPNLVCPVCRTVYAHAGHLVLVRPVHVEEVPVTLRLFIFSVILSYIILICFLLQAPSKIEV